jgi:transposase
MGLRPTPQLWEVPTVAESIPRFAALDVHANVSQAAVFEPLTGELRSRRITGPPSVGLGLLAELGPGVRAVYEAGPTGFGLARGATERGIDLRVVSPGQIPRRPADRVKTDRRDAERMVRLLAAGELRFAHVPTVEQERFRDLVRAIDDARKDQMRARHRLSKFLLRRELCFPGKEDNWTQRHLAWLDSLRFDDPASAATFVDYLVAVRAITQRRQLLIETLERLVPDSPHAQTIARLRCFRGVDTLTAAGLCAEVTDFGRFGKPKQLWGFLGIVPSEHSSGDERRQGAITKAGSAHARRLLVEAVPKYRHRPAVGAKLARRQRGQDPRVVETAWRCQRRVHKRWLALVPGRGKPKGVATVACARELAAFLWEAAMLD